MENPRNPMDLIRWGKISELDRILRACGIDEACITGGASDYDKFLALAETMPLCGGHPVQTKIHRILRESIGFDVPLCPHTARNIWQAWIDIHWYGGEADLPTFPSECPLCRGSEPMYLKMDQLSKLPDPVKIKRSNMGEWTRELESALMDSGLMPFFALPEDYFFVRPDPYHVGEAIRSLLSNGELPPAQRNLLDTQALRVWGQLACKQKWKGTILLRGGRGSEIVRLLDYLKTSKALCTMAWVPNEPVDAAYICGLHHSVGTGIDLSFDGTTEQKKKIVAQYAAIAPLGRAIVLQ